MLKDLFQDRRNAVEVQERLASYYGVNKGSMTPYAYKDELSAFSMKSITVKDAQQDCLFFQKTGMITMDEAGGMNQFLFSSVW